MPNINTETITLPKTETEPKPELPPRVSTIVRIDPESSHKYGDKRWVIFEPFQDIHNTGDVSATAIPIDDERKALMIGGTLKISQVLEEVGTMSPEEMVDVYEGAFLQQDYHLGHQHFVDSVTGALALQAEIDKQS